MQTQSYFKIESRPGWVNDYSNELLHSQLEKPHFDYDRYLDVSEYHAGAKAHYRFMVENFKTPSDLQKKAKFEISFNSDYDYVVIHSVRVLRNGSITDKTHSIKFDVYDADDPETPYNLDSTKTILAFIDDLQIGDSLELSYSINNVADQTPEFDFYFYNLRAGSSAEKKMMRVVAPNDCHLACDIRNAKSNPVHNVLPNEFCEWIWENKEVTCPLREADTPSWYFQSPHLIFYTPKIDSDVHAFCCNQFELSDSLSQNVIEMANKLKIENPDLEQCILKTIRFVQDDIYYVGLEYNEYNLKPYSPNTVLERRYGDCKDKTQLLKTLLELNGVKSSPVLVHTGLRAHVMDYPSSPLLFNHAILQIESNGKCLWVDPTISSQGGSLYEIYCPNYGLGLVLDRESGGIKKQPTLNAASKKHHMVTYDFSNFDENPIIDWCSTFTGSQADAYRRTLAVVPKDRIAHYFEGYLIDRLGEIEELEPLQVSDDREKNVLKLYGKYQAPEFWELTEEEQKEIYSFYYGVDRIKAEFSLDICKGRKGPYEVPFPAHTIEEYNFVGSQLIEGEGGHEVFETDELIFTSKNDVKNGYTFQRTFELQTKKDYIPVESLALNRNVIKEINESYYKYNYVDSLPVEVATPFTSYISAAMYLISFGCVLKKWLSGKLKDSI